MSFHVGQKITPRADDLWVNVATGNMVRGVVYPRFGEVYTIREIITDVEGSWLTLVEIRNRRLPAGEPQFDAEDFRPVVEKQTDISIFTSLLNTNQREHELT